MMPRHHGLLRGLSWSFVLLLFVSGCASAPRQTGTGAQIDSAMLFQPTPKAAESLWQQAEREKAAGNMPAAIAIWNRIAQTYPNNIIAARALYEVGHFHLQQGEAEKSLLYLDYLIYHYGQWEGIPLARLDQMRAWSLQGRNRQVQREANALWTASSGQPAVQVGLSELMARISAGEGAMDTALDWLAAGFSVARSPEDKKILTQATLKLLETQNEDGLNRLYRRNYDDFMRVFLDFRRIQLELQRAPSNDAREKLRALLQQNPSHPVAEEGRLALRGSVVEQEFPVNAGRIGVLAPVAGSYAQYGELVMRGLALANTEWNEKNPQDPITLVIKDAQADEARAASALNALVQTDNVLAVIGPLGAQAAKAASPLANRLGVPLLTLTQREEDDSVDRTFAVHLLLDNKELVTALLRHCQDKRGYKRFAVLYPEDRYGQRLAKTFAEVVNEMGLELLASVSYKSKTTDFKEPIEKLLSIARKNAPPSGIETTPFDALFIPDQVLSLSMIAPQLPYYNVVGVTLLGTNLWAEGPLLQAGGVYVEQALFATPFFAGSNAPKVRAFRERYEATYKNSPSYLGAQAYDALSLVLEARSRLHPSQMNRLDLMENLLTLRDFEGVAGTYTFYPNGELKRDYQILQVLNNELVQVGP